MDSMLRISDAAAIGLHAMVCLAQPNDGDPVSAVRMATDLHVSEAHLSKVLQRLGRRGLVISKRGPGGGFVLGKPTDQVNLLEIYEAIEGPLPMGECLLGRSDCAFGDCVLGGLIQDVQSRIHDYFKSTTLADLMARVGSGSAGQLVAGGE